MILTGFAERMYYNAHIRCVKHTKKGPFVNLLVFPPFWQKFSRLEARKSKEGCLFVKLRLSVFLRPKFLSSEAIKLKEEETTHHSQLTTLKTTN
jgi:hypothetical protein